MSGDRKLLWLALTPEPERELPAVVARLRGRGEDSGERRRVDRLILRGTRRSWRRYLDEVTGLALAAAAAPGADATAALTAAEVVLDHHRMLIGLPGGDYAATAGSRKELERVVAELHTRVEQESRGGT